jgi:serine/threonine-protein kinase
MIGKEIANYRITEMLGEGGMGVVYKGVDVNLDRPVAIKVLSSDLVRNPELVERFRAEARAQANLNHTNLATLYSFVVHEGTAMMVMEFVDGETLEKMIRRRGPIPSQEAIPLFKQALLGIGYAHRRGIIHRDLKPSNLMLSRNGMVKVMDFGIAKVMGTRGLTRTGTQMGTAFYMSPEQVLNKAVDIRSDIYSLGVTLYEMLSAHVPFEAESDYQIMASHVSAAPPLPTRFYPYIPKGVENAVLRAIEKNADARFQTVEEFGEALEHPEDYVAPRVAVAASPGRTVGEGGIRVAPTPVPESDEVEGRIWVAPTPVPESGEVEGRIWVAPTPVPESGEVGGGTWVAPATVPESGEAAFESAPTRLPREEEARGRPGFFPSKNASLALAGAVVVLVGVLLFAIRPKPVPPLPPPPQNTNAAGNTEPATDQNKTFLGDHTIPNATQTEQGVAHNAYLPPTSQTSPQNSASGTLGLVGPNQETAKAASSLSIIAANQASAVASLRTLNNAATGFWLAYKRYPASLSELARPIGGVVAIDEALASGTKSGYVFTYSAGEKNAAQGATDYEIYVDPDTGRQELRVPRAASPAHIDTYTIHADPVTPGRTGQNHYFTDDTGVIRQERDRPANAQSSPLTG